MNRKFLVVDDQPIVLNYIIEILKRLGYESLAAADGFEALKLFESGFIPDVMITDVNMPGMTGLELVEKLYERKIALPPVVFVTAETDQNTLVEIQRLHGFYMHKPFGLDKFRALIDRIVCELPVQPEVPLKG